MRLRERWRDLVSGGPAAVGRSEAERERIRMINLGLVFMVLIGLPFSLQYVRLGLPIVAGGVWFAVATGIAVMVMIRRGISIRLCGYFAGTALYLLLLVSNLNSGGFYDPNFAWFYVLPLVGAMWVDARAALWWSIVVIATALAFWIAQELGVTVPNHVSEDVHAVQSLFNRLSALVAVAVLLTMFVRSHDRAREKVERLAHFDVLTDLPNRRGLMKRIESALDGRSAGAELALLFIDLDRFKTVNDSLGHRAGDRLLAAVSKRLSIAVATWASRDGRDTDVARFGGDEFAVTALVADDAEAGELGVVVLDALREPVELDGYRLHIGGSVGIALSPGDGETGDDLLVAADLAMYEAKRRGGMAVAFCTDALVDASRRWIDVDAGLRKAIENDEFLLVFQPILDLATRRPTAVEALLRWRRADGELVSPTEFIPVAEATGAIVDIGEWVLRRAHAAARRIAAACDQPIRMSVNVSVAQLRSSRLTESVIELVDDGDLPRGWLELELTESMLLEDYRLITDLMEHLGQHGVEFAIDDFGTGYSSLSYVAGLPANRLKVDREFITTATGSKRQREVTSAIFAMAERLGLPTVAEGIETAEAAELVRELGCTEGQGNHFFEPLVLDDLLAALTSSASKSVDRIA